MDRRHAEILRKELSLQASQVQATAELLDGGATLPFIARYRKEATGSLTEVQIAALRDRLEQLRQMDRRREAILKSLEELGFLTEELKASLLAAPTPTALEDLYLPYRPKRRTRASTAREKGLEPLAHILLEQKSSVDPASEAARFVTADGKVASAEEALAGARDIIAEQVAESPEGRSRLRRLFSLEGMLKSRAVAGKEKEAAPYRDYLDREEPLEKAPSHRVLAVRRGEKQGVLAFRVAIPEEKALAELEPLFVEGSGEASREVREAVRDGLRRLLLPAMETEAKQRAGKRAEEEAVAVFADNLRHLLMAPPLGERRVMAVDPGFRTGCKTVCLDAQGNLVHREALYPHSGDDQAARAAERFSTLVEEYAIEAVAVGNGTAGRETEAFLKGLSLAGTVPVILVDERGASVYSASETAREEFPDEDITVRGAVSIGRRLMDPLAELVKIDPKSIGVGQYQHDVDPKELKKSLDEVVTSCVNAVGVELNTASPHLLSYVSGIGPRLAGNIVAHRRENGPFSSRKDLKKVERLGPKAFEQAAGFLRIAGGKNPLDATGIHPESYGIVEAMAKDLGLPLSKLLRSPGIADSIDPGRYVSRHAGLPTVKDILEELKRPGRDPRSPFQTFSFASKVHSPEDLQVGMKLPGVVTNVTAFGAFVDIGVHRDGLVHVSRLADRFVKDPREVVRAGQPVTVTVVEVDLERNRIGLSMRE